MKPVDEYKPIEMLLRAEECRAEAETMRNPFARRGMIIMAKLYTDWEKETRTGVRTRIQNGITTIIRFR